MAGTVEPPLAPEVAAAGGLRTGWTTGTCAAAAAKAALVGLAAGVAPVEVEVGLPGGRRVRFPVEAEAPNRCVVVKDAGDDPDCTDGARMTAEVTWAAAPLLRAGDGIGVVTQPGLGLAVGEPSITSVPRRMIAAALAEVDARPVAVTFSVPGGQAMAAKTSNARLGIVGGISILGTTGVVKPFSTAAYRASVVQQIDVAAAQGAEVIVLCTGTRSDAFAQRALPHLPAVCFVEVGDFTGAALREAVDRGLTDVVFVGMAGKLTKLASGVLMTHYTKSKVDPEVLVEVTRSVTDDAELLAGVAAANTARHAYEQWEAAGVLRPVGDALCTRVAEVLHRFSGLTARVAMVDPGGRAVVAATEPQWVSA